MKIICPKIEKDNMLPCVVEKFDKLNKGKRWISEPKHCKIMDLHQIDIVLVPGTKFDKYGHRKGRGKGYYDRFLSQIPQTLKIWLTYNISPSFNTNSWDVDMDKVVVLEKI